MKKPKVKRRPALNPLCVENFGGGFVIGRWNKGGSGFRAMSNTFHRKVDADNALEMFRRSCDQ